MRLILLFSFPAVLAAETFTIHPSPSSHFALMVDKTGLFAGKTHQFLFERYVGTLKWDRQQPDNSEVTFSIESASAVCKDTWVDAKDLKKIETEALVNQLAAGRYPSIEFRSSAITRRPDGKFDVRGTLKIRAIEKPIVVNVQVGPGDALTGSAIVKLSDYNLKPPKAAFGAIGTKDDMRVEFTLFPEAWNKAPRRCPI
jgi:polyisoprenoid-binding protein YceI